MKYILPILILFCISCKHDPKIEIYLLKDRVDSYEGVPSLQVAKFDTLKNILIEDGLADTRYDTIKNEFIFAGKFNASIHDLQDKPFIKNNQIIKLNTKNNEITLDSVAAEKMSKMVGNFRYGTQFVITLDKRPVVTGYFWNSFSSYWCHTYHIMYHTNVSINEPSRSYQLFYEPIKNTGGLNQPPYPPELIEAFRSSARLIK